MAGQPLSATINWDAWTPGNIPAARQAAKLDELIATAVGRNPSWSDRAAQRGSLLASIEDHRLDRLASAVADAVARGDSADTLARTLRGVLDDPQWAGMVATTEMARAMTAASIESYRTSGVVEAYSILTANDVRVCQDCQTNQDDGPYPLDTDPPAGICPTHPGCRCAVIADTMPLADAQAMGYVPGISSGALDDTLGNAEAEAEPTEPAPPPPVDIAQHDTVGSTRHMDPSAVAAALAALGARRQGQQDTADEEDDDEG